MREYSALSLDRIPAGSRIARPEPPGRVSLDDPAFSVMTDLREVAAVTTRPEEAMYRAHQVMIERGVRLLFVVDTEGALAGVITATDILGDKPLRFTRERSLSHAEITVADVMTPADRLEALPMQDVAQMRVGHIVATMKAVRRQHLMVADEGGRLVRGIFSASQVARQLGMELQTFSVASTFAEIEAALAR
ncbi:MAG TPA: CBS domain-containing protein [Usitatibacter sp.]|nr:CBS domain-containing protein [Usitatibacter sp.]